MVTVDDLAMITSELAVDNQSKNEVDQDIPFSVEKNGKKEDEIEDSDVAFISEDAVQSHKSDELQLANTSFLHGRTYSTDIYSELATMNHELQTG